MYIEYKNGTHAPYNQSYPNCRSSPFITFSFASGRWIPSNDFPSSSLVKSGFSLYKCKIFAAFWVALGRWRLTIRSSISCCAMFKKRANSHHCVAIHLDSISISLPERWLAFVMNHLKVKSYWFQSSIEASQLYYINKSIIFHLLNAHCGFFFTKKISCKVKMFEKQVQTRVNVLLPTNWLTSCLSVFRNRKNAYTSFWTIGLVQMTSKSPCWVPTSKFRHLVDQIINGNPFVYMDLPQNLGIRATAR